MINGFMASTPKLFCHATLFRLPQLLRQFTVYIVVATHLYVQELPECICGAASLAINSIHSSHP